VIPTITVLLGDPNLPDESKPGGRFTDDDLFQVEKLRAALMAIPDREFDFWNDHTSLFERLRDERPDFVLNFCDTGFYNRARHELHIPALLEMLGIPYSGAGPVALGLCYDKSLVRAVAAAHGVPVPDETFLRAGSALGTFSYPAFVKPNRGDGSVGITQASIVADPAAARATIAALRRDDPAGELLVQEFLSGEEYGIGVIGNPADGLAALPVMAIDYSALDPALPRLLDYSSKVDPASPYWNDIRYPAAILDAATQSAMLDWVTTLFGRLQLRDYARFDFRTNAAGQIKLLEVNPNPAWCWDGKLAHMGELAGLNHSDVLARIIAAAERRIAAGG
jgi:D-alanine-D-alanine ligase